MSRRKPQRFTTPRNGLKRGDLGADRGGENPQLWNIGFAFGVDTGAAFGFGFGLPMLHVGQGNFFAQFGFFGGLVDNLGRGGWGG